MKTRIALVTGGTRGIGASITLALKNKGYKVIANYHKNHEAAKEFAKQHAVEVSAFDVGSYEECQKACLQLKESYGAIDVLVHNAGITRDSFFHKMSPQMWQEVITTNLTSCFNMAQPVVIPMRENGFGRIIFLSSINALKGQAGQVNYCAAKAGIIGFAKALALETASKGITVNVIAPGYTDTEMVRAVSEPILEKIISQIPVGRLGQVDEIAKCVLFLAAEEAGFITGETLNINGGQYLS
ncbi:MAG: acetoacetyl-CoA reductase [Alphaproteobacteria bacterium]|nr:acetoacetyl-CoA reductase [Alphaproteobacteria bacterium]